MSTLEIVLVAILTTIVVIAVGGWLIWRRASAESRRLMKRLSALSLGDQLRLALSITREERIPLYVRALLPAIVVYLALPLDLIPDFIPVIGQLDDLLIVVAGLGVLVKLTPRDVLEEHIRRYELVRPLDDSRRLGSPKV